MSAKDTKRWLKNNPRLSEQDLVTITIPRQQLLELRDTLRDHRKLGNKLGWPSWMVGLCGWKLDEVLKYLDGKLRNKK
jgi:hypothetical protein